MSLLSNAFKFTCSGGRVDVSFSLVEGQDSREMLEIRVADTGIGIKKEDRESIFGHFYQVDYPEDVYKRQEVALTLHFHVSIHHANT